MDYITIIKGDDTNFVNDQFIVINFNTDIDLSGFTATFSLDNITLTYGDLSSKTFEIILSNEITSNLKIGKQYGELKLIDTQNRVRTITSVIPFLVKNGISEKITYINQTLEITTNINNTTMDISIETAGISLSQATSYLNQMQNLNSSAQSYVNSAQNYANISNVNADIAVQSANQAVENNNFLYTLLNNAEIFDLTSEESGSLVYVRNTDGIALRSDIPRCLSDLTNDLNIPTMEEIEEKFSELLNNADLSNVDS